MNSFFLSLISKEKEKRQKIDQLSGHVNALFRGGKCLFEWRVYPLAFINLRENQIVSVELYAGSIWFSVMDIKGTIIRGKMDGSVGQFLDYFISSLVPLRERIGKKSNLLIRIINLIF